MEREAALISVRTNTNALFAQAAIASVRAESEAAMDRLSSGKRINAAKDDAAGIAITTRQTSQIRGMDQSIRNSLDAQSLIDTAEGGLQEITESLQRIRELAVQAASDTYSAGDRAGLDSEAQQLLAGIDAIASDTTWAGQNLLDGALTNKSFQVGAGSLDGDNNLLGHRHRSWKEEGQPGLGRRRARYWTRDCVRDCLRDVRGPDLREGGRYRPPRRHGLGVALVRVPHAYTTPRAY